MNILNGYDIFISFKDSDGNGNDTEDKAIANEIYEELTEKGFKVFFSPETFKKLGVDKWNEELENALYTSTILIAIGTKKSYMESKYVKWERDTFTTWRSKDTRRRMYAYISPPMTMNDLPDDIKQLSVFVSERKEDLYEYVTNHLKNLKKIFIYKVVASSISMILIGGYILKSPNSLESEASAPNKTSRKLIIENNLTLERKDIELKRKDIVIEHKNIELERKDIIIEHKDIEIEKLQKELNTLRSKYENNSKALSQADIIQNILGIKEAIAYLKDKDKDLHYANFEHKIKGMDFDKWFKNSIHKIVVVFDTKTEDRTILASAVTRKGAESEKLIGTMKLKASDEFLVIKNSSWSPLPITLKILDEKGKEVYRDINKDNDETLFIVSREVLRDGYRVLVSDGFGELVVDVEIEL